MSTRYGALTGAGIPRRSRLILVAVLAAALVLPTARADANGEIYMKTTSPNLVGESTDEKHAGWIELHSFKWGGVSRTDRNPNARATFAPVVIEKYVDRSSPYLMQFAAAGYTMGSVLIAVTKMDGGVITEYDRYCLENVVVMSNATSARADGERTLETATLSYTKFERWYEMRDGAGNKQRFTTGWDTLAYRGTPFNPGCGGGAPQ